MKTSRSLLGLFACLIYSFLLLSCGDGHDHHDHAHDHDHAGHGHAHVAPHGGALVLLGKHGSGYHLEVVLAEDGLFDVYVLDGEAEKFVRVKQENLSLQVSPIGDGNATTVTLSAVADKTTGEAVGDTSRFSAQTNFGGLKKFEGVVNAILIKGASFENVAFRYPEGNE